MFEGVWNSALVWVGSLSMGTRIAIALTIIVVGAIVEVFIFKKISKLNKLIKSRKAATSIIHQEVLDPASQAFNLLQKENRIEVAIENRQVRP